MEDDTFLGPVHVGTAGNNLWRATLAVSGALVQFKIDTSTDIGVMPESAFSKLKGITLKPAFRSLRGPSKRPLYVHGQFTATLKHRANEVKEEICIVQGLQMALLGHPAIIALGLVARANAVEDTEKKIVARYQDLQGEHHIMLKGAAKQLASHNSEKSCRSVAAKGVGRAREDGTAGCDHKSRLTHWMAVIPKAYGKVRICVDLTRMNKSVCRERLILPSRSMTSELQVPHRESSKLGLH